ncbi:hypothetical protein D3C81_1721160 [compost metagenome]
MYLGFILLVIQSQILNDLITDGEDLGNLLSPFSNRLGLFVHRLKFLTEAVEFINNKFCIISL